MLNDISIKILNHHNLTDIPLENMDKKFTAIICQDGTEFEYTDTHEQFSWFYDLNNGIKPDIVYSRSEIRQWIIEECSGKVLAVQTPYADSFIFYFSETADALAFKIKFAGSC